MKEQPPKGRPKLSDKGLSKAESRQQRLAAALRRNLKRRKLQQGSRNKAQGPVDAKAGDEDNGG